MVIGDGQLEEWMRRGSCQLAASPSDADADADAKCPPDSQLLAFCIVGAGDDR
jgi:hypothetical protein